MKPHAVLSNGEKFRASGQGALVRQLAGGLRRVQQRRRPDDGEDRLSRNVKSHSHTAGSRNRETIRSPSPVIMMSWNGWSRIGCWTWEARCWQGAASASPHHAASRRVERAIWPLFKRHHYLSSHLHPSAVVNLAEIDGRPAASPPSSVTRIRRSRWREHRTVCLPEFQGIGIGSAISEFVAISTSPRPTYYSATCPIPR